eukprot:TRINITY_DN5338_c0_g2_i2.p1 TRINITY_DN5338_c0_g2~~TRINITY_DN5338_c0_g2_i2.p1  ORF type:complete len:441 (-),score=130.87 TRINITY_DN5338_c0_g2_i2:300-1622(-)
MREKSFKLSNSFLPFLVFLVIYFPYIVSSFDSSSSPLNYQGFPSWLENKVEDAVKSTEEQIIFPSTTSSVDEQGMVTIKESNVGKNEEEGMEKVDSNVQEQNQSLQRKQLESRLESSLEDEEQLGVSLLCGDRIPPSLSMPPEINALIVQAKRLSSSKPSKAEALFKKLLLMENIHPDSLNCYGEFLEYSKGDIQSAHHFYSQALFVFPKHQRALMNIERIGGRVKKMEEDHYDNIATKLNQLRRSKKPLFVHQEKHQHILHVYHTNAIEGSPVTFGETKSLLETGKVGTNLSPSLEITQLFEVISTSEAIHFVQLEAYQGKQSKRMVDLLDILQIHKKVLSRVDPEEGGKYRSRQVIIADHIPPHSNDVPFLMTKLDRWLNSPETLKMHVIERAALAHYHLVWIHPFSDGNGRTARMLMNLMLMREGYPPALIKKRRQR